MSKGVAVGRGEGIAVRVPESPDCSIVLVCRKISGCGGHPHLSSNSSSNRNTRLGARGTWGQGTAGTQGGHGPPRPPPRSGPSNRHHVGSNCMQRAAWGGVGTPVSLYSNNKRQARGLQDLRYLQTRRTPPARGAGAGSDPRVPTPLGTYPPRYPGS